MPKTLTPVQTFLAPLAGLAARHPDIEAEVIWANAMDWDAQDDASEMLDAEEIAFYAEGLLMEGFGMIWQAIADVEAPKVADHILLMFWEGAAPEPPGGPGEGWTVLAQGAWPAGRVG